MTDASVTAGLTAAVQSGNAHLWKSGRQSKYWHLDAQTYARERLLDAAASEASSGAELVRRAARLSKGQSQAAVKQVFDTLKREKQIVGKKLVGQGALYYRPGSERALIKGSVRLLREKLLSLGAGAADIQTEFAGGDNQPELQPPVPAVEPSQAAADFSEAILAALRELEPAPGTPVSIPRLRAAVPQAGKREFDDAVLKLADTQLVYLTRHDHGRLLSESEQAELVFDGKEALYVAVASRN